MKISNLIKAFSRALFTPLALGIALGLTQPGNAATVNKGTDYLITPTGGGTYDFGGSIGFVSFSGLPIGGASGIADTIVNRLDSITAPYLPTLPVNDLINGTLPLANVTPIQIVGLSLAAEGPYQGKIFVGLDPTMTSTGKMAIAHAQTGDDGGIWSSYFNINGIAIVANTGETLTPSGDDYIKGLISKCGTGLLNYTCHPFSKGLFVAEDEPWSHQSYPNHIIGQNLVSSDPTNFYLSNCLVHVAPGSTHGVSPFSTICVPSPLPILGASTAYGFARRLRKRCREAVKVS